MMKLAVLMNDLFTQSLLFASRALNLPSLLWSIFNDLILFQEMSKYSRVSVEIPVKSRISIALLDIQIIQVYKDTKLRSQNFFDLI